MLKVSSISIVTSHFDYVLLEFTTMIFFFLIEVYLIVKGTDLMCTAGRILTNACVLLCKQHQDQDIEHFKHPQCSLCSLSVGTPFQEDTNLNSNHNKLV